MFQITVLVLAVLSGVIGYLIGTAWGVLEEKSASFSLYLALFGCISGLTIGFLLSSVLNSASAMVFVAFAENPDALKVSRYAIYRQSTYLCFYK